MAGVYDVWTEEGGAWLYDKYGVAYWSPTGKPGYWSYGPVDPSLPYEAPEFIEDEPSCADPEMHGEAACEIGMHADEPNPFLLDEPPLLAFREAGWHDMAECNECWAMGREGLTHRGCGGRFTLTHW